MVGYLTHSRCLYCYTFSLSPYLYCWHFVFYLYHHHFVLHNVPVRSHTLPASFCISTFRCIYSYYCVSHTVHVRTWLRPDHVRTAARLEFVTYSPCHSQFLFRTKFTCERGCIFRSDHVRTVAHLQLARNYILPWWVFISYEVHVRTGLPFHFYYTLHGWRMFHVDSYEVHVQTGLIF